MEIFNSVIGFITFRRTRRRLMNFIRRRTGRNRDFVNGSERTTSSFEAPKSNAKVTNNERIEEVKKEIKDRSMEKRLYGQPDLFSIVGNMTVGMNLSGLDLPLESEDVEDLLSYIYSLFDIYKENGVGTGWYSVARINLKDNAINADVFISKVLPLLMKKFPKLKRITCSNREAERKIRVAIAERTIAKYAESKKPWWDLDLTGFNLTVKDFAALISSIKALTKLEKLKLPAIISTAQVKELVNSCSTLMTIHFSGDNSKKLDYSPELSEVRKILGERVIQKYARRAKTAIYETDELYRYKLLLSDIYLTAAEVKELLPKIQEEFGETPLKSIDLPGSIEAEEVDILVGELLTDFPNLEKIDFSWNYREKKIRITKALQKIKEANKTLDLSEIALTGPELKALTPRIKNIEDLGALTLHRKTPKIHAVEELVSDTLTLEVVPTAEVVAVPMAEPIGSKRRSSMR